MAHGKERSKFGRRGCLMRCLCDGEGFHFYGYIVDISCGGAGIVETKELPAPGTQLLLK
jgi:hypothetical protein